MSWNKKELEVYDYVSLKEFDEINALRTAKREGRYEEKINIAKNLLDVLDDDIISKKTGLDIEIIKNLRKEKKWNSPTPKTM